MNLWIVGLGLLLLVAGIISFVHPRLTEPKGSARLRDVAMLPNMRREDREAVGIHSGARTGRLRLSRGRTSVSRFLGADLGTCPGWAPLGTAANL